MKYEIDMADRIKTIEAELAAEKANMKERDEAEAKYAALKSKYEETKNAGAYYQSKSGKQTEQLSQQKRYKSLIPHPCANTHVKCHPKTKAKDCRADK